MKLTYILYLVILSACAAPGDPEPSTSATAQENAIALRYTLTVLNLHANISSDKIVEINLPAYGVTCNISHSGSGLGGDKSRYPAHAFFSAIRNATGGELFSPPEHTAVEPIQVPAELAARIVELARLTERQTELAEQLGRDLMQVTPLNLNYEYRHLIDEATRAKSLPGYDNSVQDILDRAETLIWDKSIHDKPGAMRDLRTQVEKMLLSQPSP